MLRQEGWWQKYPFYTLGKSKAEQQCLFLALERASLPRSAKVTPMARHPDTKSSSKATALLEMSLPAVFRFGVVWDAGKPHNLWELSSEVHAVAHTSQNVSPSLFRGLHFSNCIQFMHSGFSCKAIKHTLKHQRYNSEAILWLLGPGNLLMNLEKWLQCRQKLVYYSD